MAGQAGGIGPATAAAAAGAVPVTDVAAAPGGGRGADGVTAGQAKDLGQATAASAVPVTGATPAAGAENLVSANPPDQPDQPGPASSASAAASPAGAAGSPDGTGPAAATAAAQSGPATPTGTDLGNGQAVTGLIFGILCVFGCWLGLISAALVILALAFSVIGILRARLHFSDGMAVAVTGVVLGVAGLGLYLAFGALSLGMGFRF